MLTTLVTCLESSTQYFLIPHLCSRSGHAVVWLQSPAEQGAQHAYSPHISPCRPAVRGWLYAHVPAVDSLFLICSAATCAMTGNASNAQCTHH